MNSALRQSVNEINCKFGRHKKYIIYHYILVAHDYRYTYLYTTNNKFKYNIKQYKKNIVIVQRVVLSLPNDLFQATKVVVRR